MNRIPSFEFRRRAMAVIRPVMQVLIVVALIAALPGLISSVVTLRTGADPNAYLTPVVDKMNSFMTSITPETTEEAINAQSDALVLEMLAAYETFFEEKGAIYLGMLALQLLLTPALTVALHGGLLDAVRRREVSLPGSLSRLRLAPRALVLFLWIVLRAYAWMLPGLALVFVSAFLPDVPAILLMLGGTVLSVVLGVRAMLHYILAPIALVDDPSLSFNGCIRASHSIMRRRKAELFCLEISFAGWMLLLYAITLMCIVMFGSVLGMALSMMAELLLNVYMSAAQVCFYTAYCGKPEIADDAVSTTEDDGQLN